MTIFSFVFRAGRKVYLNLLNIYSQIHATILFKGNQVNYGKQFKSYGVPIVNVWPKGTMIVGNDFKINNGDHYNVIGRQQPCCFVVMNNAVLQIGHSVGMSATAIVCSNNVKIGDYVKIGGNTVIYDTDFHSLDPDIRRDSRLDKKSANSAPVIIGNNVFIGAHSTILKGVEIGNNSIIGSCSVVTKNVPANEIWGGNPAKFIKFLSGS